MKALAYITQLAIPGVFCVLVTEETQAQRTSLSHDLDPLRGPPWGQGGPWADQEPYTPHPKPLDWIDPNPSRWPWTASRDPYSDAGSGQWKEAPWVGPGVQIAVGQGRLNATVPFIARVKFRANAEVPAHAHSAVRHVRVLSGVLNLGLGERLETSKTHAFGPGSTAILLPTINHFFWFKEETVIQLHGVGPWVVTYADPADDPKRNQRPSVSAPP